MAGRAASKKQAAEKEIAERLTLISNPHRDWKCNGQSDVPLDIKRSWHVLLGLTHQSWPTGCNRMNTVLPGTVKKKKQKKKKKKKKGSNSDGSDEDSEASDEEEESTPDPVLLL